MRYGDLSHTEVIISHEEKLLLDKYFILLKGHFQRKREVKESFWARPWDMEIYPMAISQSEYDIFP